MNPAAPMRSARRQSHQFPAIRRPDRWRGDLIRGRPAGAGSGFDGTFLWNIASRRPFGPLTAPISFPNLSAPSMSYLAFSPDSKFLRV
jgi:hypothetical protein